MQATVDPIEYLQLSKEFHPSASQAVDSIYDTVHRSDPSHDASRYTLPNDCLPIVGEAQKLYQKNDLTSGVENVTTWSFRTVFTSCCAEAKILSWRTTRHCDSPFSRYRECTSLCQRQGGK
ncbi:predicted protein [Histoplasma capsulatum H143]|uniref:Uncharacterized protein n=1 Tax=Ajellomyces capsulatus (strain H143) TaxID=544712 RepID=C6HTI8_AJECH|nr:predicted protein [Histoplasma capsulatum H143]